MLEVLDPSKLCAVVWGWVLLSSKMRTSSNFRLQNNIPDVSANSSSSPFLFAPLIAPAHKRTIELHCLRFANMTLHETLALRATWRDAVTSVHVMLWRRTCFYVTTRRQVLETDVIKIIHCFLHLFKKFAVNTQWSKWQNHQNIYHPTTPLKLPCETWFLGRAIVISYKNCFDIFCSLLLRDSCVSKCNNYAFFSTFVS